METKEPIRIKDLRWINALSVFGILLMIGAIIWNIVSMQKGWIWYIILDFFLACVNLWAMIWSLRTQRDRRVEEEKLFAEAEAKTHPTISPLKQRIGRMKRKK